MKNKKICSLLVMLSLVCILKTYGQFNIKVGYAGGFTKAPVLNRVVDRFNTKYQLLEDKLDQFRSLHGLEVGVRYRLNRVGFELSWNSMSDKSDAFGTLDGIDFKDKWFLTMSEYSFGLENYYGKLGYGASLGYRTARIKTAVSNSSRKKRSVTNESGLTSNLYLIFQFPGEKVGIAFKPYIQFPFKNLNVVDFDRELNIQLDDTYQTALPQDEKFLIYGISIVLYNGRQ